MERSRPPEGTIPSKPVQGCNAPSGSPAAPGLCPGINKEGSAGRIQKYQGQGKRCNQC